MSMLVRDHLDPLSRRQDQLRRQFAAMGYPYYKWLCAHTGCVNTVEFSPATGGWLASGSDDTSVRLWSVDEIMSSIAPKPLQTFIGHSANVFYAGFDPLEESIISCGADGIIRKHRIDASTRFPEATLTGHEDTVQKVSLHPNQPQVLISASDDGTIKLWDFRSTTRCMGTIQETRALHGISFVPSNPSAFLVSGDRAFLALMDFRMSFDAARASSGLKRRRNSRCMLTRYKAPRSHDVASFAVSPNSAHFVSLHQRSLPRIWSFQTPDPLVILSHPNPLPEVPGDELNPSFHRPHYSNAVTHKVPAWSPDGRHVVSGSDDFGIYIWRVPPLIDLSLPPPLTPTRVTHAEHVLFGHRSIPNRVALHQDMPLIASSGVESRIMISSPVELSGCTSERKRRGLFSRASSLQAFRHSLLNGPPGRTPNTDQGLTDDEENRTLAFFDFILRDEHQTDGEDEDSEHTSVTSDDSDSIDQSDEGATDTMRIRPRYLSDQSNRVGTSSSDDEII